MPRNRRSVDREEKQAELLAAAEALFVSRGYAGTTMAAIAARAGVAPNSIYWYYRSKDELLVAILDQKLSAAVAETEAAPPAGILETLTAGINRLQSFPALGALVHERLPHSPAVADFHDRLHEALRRRLITAVEGDGFRPEDAPLVADLIIAVIDADPEHGGTRTSRDVLLGFLLARLADVRITR